MIHQLIEAMQKYDHVCPNVDLLRCDLCQERWEYEKKKLHREKKRKAKLERR